VIVPLEMSVLARLARILGAGRMALSSVILLPRSIAAERERFATPS
jgi:hypothetical protein